MAIGPSLVSKFGRRRRISLRELEGATRFNNLGFCVLRLNRQHLQWRVQRRDVCAKRDSFDPHIRDCIAKESTHTTIKTNVMGTMNMLGLAKRVGARILLTSTSEVYGDPLVHPQPETYWGNVNPIEIRVARIFNTYGPRMNIDDGRVVSNFIAQALRDEPLTVQGHGTQTRSFCYVSDMVDGLIRLMEGEHTGPINIGNPGEFTMIELAETVKELISPSIKIITVDNTPDDPKQRKPIITKANELLGWEPKIKLREGLPHMVDDFRQRLGIPKKN